MTAAADTLALPAQTLGLLVALALGFVIGLERGWRERERAEGGRVAGLRTFALVGLLGGVFGLVGPWLTAAGALGLAWLGEVGYRESVRASGNLSATSAVALLLTYGLGAYAVLGSPTLALAAAVIVAVLLDLRPTLHRWLRLMEHRELSAGLQMLVLSVVVLPLLPDAAYGPFGALNPYRLWWAVVLIAGLSLAGHVAMRIVGPQAGALWTGLLGGLASSTAATLALARKVRAEPSLATGALAGAQAASALMFVRLALILLSFAPVLGRQMLWPLVAAALVLLGVALRTWRGRERAPASDAGAAPGAATVSEMRPFDLGTALGFGAFLGGTALATEAARTAFGASGVYGIALLSGLADVDAIAVALARLQQAGSVAAEVAALGVAAAVLANTVAKAAMAAVTAGRAFAWRLLGAYTLAMLAGVLAFAITRAV